ncbi:MAG: c-type cytochrome [Pseudomonadota bacterium]|jgi:cytochrome c553
MMAFFIFLNLFSSNTQSADAALGKAKAQMCASCHGVNGIGISKDIPNIAAQPALTIFYQLIQFRDGLRKGGNMEMFAKDLTNEDIKDIAAYYSELKAPPAKSGGDAAKIAFGEKIAQQNYCNSCHAANFQGQKQAPRLAGQSSEYFVKQLKDLRSGARIDMDGTMGSAAKNLTDAEIEALAAYAESLK